MTLLELKTLTVRGTPRELGHAQGEALREAIGAFVEQRLTALKGYLAERKEAARFDEFVEVGRRCLATARNFATRSSSATGTGSPPAIGFSCACPVSISFPPSTSVNRACARSARFI